MQSSNVRVKTYTGESLDVIGSIVVDVEYESQRESLQLHIVAGAEPTLLGRDWLHKLKLNWPAICHLSSSLTLESVLDMHNTLFNEELGCVQGMSAKIHVEPGSSPQFCKARPVPFALSLDRLHESGVIEPVEYAEWVAPIVPVIKSDGSVRICGDYKVTVNRVAKVDSYPLPRIDDLFALLAGGKLFSKLDLALAYQQIPLAD